MKLHSIVIGTQIFPTNDGPAYLPGKIAVIILFLALGGVVLIMRWVNIRMNKSKAIALAKLVEENGWSEEDVLRESDKVAVSQSNRQVITSSITDSLY